MSAAWKKRKRQRGRQQAAAPGGRCPWNCWKEGRPGYFRDVDVDFGYGRFGVCAGCGGTGLDIGLTDAERDQLIAYRFSRDSLGSRQARLAQEYEFCQAVFLGRTEVLAAVDAAIAVLSSTAEFTDEGLGNVRTCAQALDRIFHYGTHQGYECWAREGLDRCNCRAQRRELLAFAELVRSLPIVGSAGYAHLLGQIHDLQRGYLFQALRTGLGELTSCTSLFKGVSLEKYLQSLRTGKELVAVAYSINPSPRLKRMLGFDDGALALLSAQKIVADPSVAMAISILAQGNRSDIDREALRPLWTAWCVFREGMQASWPSGGEIDNFLLPDCVCQEFRQGLLDARQKVELLLPADGSVEERRLREALTAEGAKLRAEILDLRKALEQPLLFEEVLLLGLVHCCWVRAGRPTGCYAELLEGVLQKAMARSRPQRHAHTPEELAAFTPDKVPAGLEGLTPKLLADLHQTVRQYGQVDYGDQICRLSLREPTELYVAVSLKPDNRNILIVGPGAVGGTEGTEVVRIGGNPPSLVFWDKRVTVEDVMQFVAVVDRLAREGATAPPPTTEAKYCVDTVFAKRGSAMPVLPGVPDAETLRQQFDRPDEIVIAKVPLGGEILHHKRDAAYVAFRERVVMAVLRKHGLATPEAMRGLTIEKVLEIRREIDARIAAAGEFVPV